MSYYLLPRNHNLIYKSLECVENKTTIKPVVSFSLADYLYDIKKKISEKGIDWDTYKKYTNPYEYIHTLIPNFKQSVSKLKPISRSFFDHFVDHNFRSLFRSALQITQFQ